MSLLNGLQLYFTLDEIDGNCASSYGTALTGSCTNITYGAVGKVNACYTFDATSNSYVDFGNTLGRPESGITISLWFNTSQSQSDWMGVFSNYEDGSGAAGWDLLMSGYVYAASDEGKLFFSLRGGIYTDLSTNSNFLNDGNWHHYLATYDQVEVKCYVDGILESSGSCSGNLTYNSSCYLRLGRRDDKWFSGQLDEVAIWNRALTQEEITEVYNKGLAGQKLIKDKTKYVSGINSGPGKLPSIVDLYGEDLITWNNFQILMKKSIEGGTTFSNPIVSTYSLVYTLDYAYWGGVLGLDNNIHFVPYDATVGQKINYLTGIVSTYSLVYNGFGLFNGGILAPNGDIHFIPYASDKGQKINASGVVSTYPIITNGYNGGVVAPNGDIHMIPRSASVGQKIDNNGTVSTYSLIYTAASWTYSGGVLAPNGDIHMIPTRAVVGQKIDINGIVSTYSLAYTVDYAYHGGALSANGEEIHFSPYYSTVGQKINIITNVVSTYSLIYTTDNAYAGAVLSPTGDIHFVVAAASVGQKVDKNGIVSTYPLVNTYGSVADLYIGGVLTPNGDIHLISSGNLGHQVGQKISTTPTKPFSMAMCCSPFLNKL